jgi:hypothetical protein
LKKLWKSGNGKKKKSKRKTFERFSHCFFFHFALQLEIVTIAYPFIYSSVGRH